MVKKSKRSTRQVLQSSSEERQDPPAATAEVAEHSGPLFSPRSPPSAYNANDEDIPYDSADADANAADLSPAYRPSSPGYDQEGSASPQSQDEKSPAEAAPRGNSPGAGNPPSDADAPLEEVSAMNKSANLPSSMREAPREIIHIDDNPKGPISRWRKRKTKQDFL